VGTRSRGQRRWTLATAVAVSLLSAGLSAAPALARTIKLNGSVIETQDVRLSVTYVGQPFFGAVILVRGDGVRTSTSTNGAGRATFSVRAGRRGRIAVTVTGASSVLRAHLRIR
jgi:hypothetical protein